MGTPAYSKRSLEASISTLVVKFPDRYDPQTYLAVHDHVHCFRDFVGFQCTISVCMKEFGNCDGVTVHRTTSRCSYGQLFSLQNATMLHR